MRNKPQKLYILARNDSMTPYREGNEVRVYNTKGRAIKQAKKLYESRSLLYRVVRCELTTDTVEVTA